LNTKQKKVKTHNEKNDHEQENVDKVSIQQSIVEVKGLVKDLALVGVR
jgi:hypothetical protein